MSELGSGIGLEDFPGVKHHLEAALRYGGGTIAIEDVEQGIREGKFQLWAGPDSVLVTEIAEFPRQRALVFCWAGGHLPEIHAMLPGIMDWGREKGCTRARFIGREGWHRTFLRHEGWHVTGIQMERAL